MTNTTNDVGNTRLETSDKSAQSACNGLLCDSCQRLGFHRAGSFYAVAEGYDDPYNYWYCSEGHWCSDIHEDNSEQKDDPWKDCKDYRKT